MEIDLGEGKRINSNLNFSFLEYCLFPIVL